MNILHVMVDEKFTRGVARFYNQFFVRTGHEILYYNRNSRNTSLIDKQLKIPQYEMYAKNDFIDSIELIRFTTKYDYVVFHSFIMPKLYRIITYIRKAELEKIIWIEWGYDLYCDNRNTINNYIKSNCKYVVCIFPEDCVTYTKAFPKHSSEVFYARYTEYPESSRFDKCYVKRDIRSDSEELVVQIGHSANRTLKHIECLEMLKRYINENIQIILPLAYGDLTYAREVKEYALRQFGNKVIVLENILPKEEYFEMISRVNVAIFASDRQIGLGSIHKHIQNQTKLFLSSSGVMYSYFFKQGVPVCKAEDIRKMSFQEFKKPSVINDIDKYNNFIDWYFNYDKRVNRWKYIFSMLQD